MEQDVLDFGFDIPKLSEQKQIALGMLIEIYDAAKKVNDTVISIHVDNSWQDLNTKQTKLRAGMNELTESVKQYQNVSAQAVQQQAKLNVQTSDAAQKVAELKLQTQQSIAANKEAAKEALGLSSAYDKLAQEFKNASNAAKSLQAQALTNPAMKAEADAASQKANDLNQKLKTIDAGIGNYQRNVGNYTGAIGILKNSLTEATAALDKMKIAGQENTEQGIQTQKEVSLLTELVGQQSAGFTSLAREVMNTGRALESMHEEGLQNTEAFKSLESEFANAKRQLVEFRNEQKLMTSQAPALSAMTLAAMGLAGAYGVGAGAAALFAGDNEKVQKTMNSLIAVMTILQGLEAIHELSLQKNTIATILFGEANVAAAAEVGVFNAALDFVAANPIVLALAGLAASFIYLASETDNTKKEIDDLKESFDKTDEAVDRLEKSTAHYGELELEALKQTGAKNQDLHDKKISNLFE